ncbi:FAD:protein FMN transferase [Xylanimonas protaetiae]|uniref:FAD:protein FMN transferase n=1 Tax=Xylanimonas protaetiae TaxID=2509457 RepID=A0A4P6F8Z4_9MICO|nr:FAD:protein FMN transferase [Xylanimonas protaetiae]QAY71373.1 FAD:protein FMN transferase [Xylanimonas protaetiae]
MSALAGRHGLRRDVTVDEVMGTRASVHVIVREGLPSLVSLDVDDAVARALASLHDADRRFSTYRDASEVRRLARGELALDDAHPDVREVEAACRAALRTTAGRFSAWWRGWFDPTGYVKGWAVDRAMDAHLADLLDLEGVAAVGLNVGGDLCVRTRPGSSWTWTVGVADPRDRGRTVARLRLADGAVATSGTAERGAHLVDPRTGGRARGVLSATVVADTLADADVWATAAAVAGDDLTWVRDAGTRSGLLVGADGRTRRWAGGVEVTTDAGW